MVKLQIDTLTNYICSGLDVHGGKRISAGSTEVIVPTMHKIHVCSNGLHKMMVVVHRLLACLGC